MKSTKDFTCSFCSNARSRGGEWHTHGGTVYCCHGCAVDVLPRLVADSIRVVQNGYVEGGKALEVASGNFWKAMAARLSSRGDA